MPNSARHDEARSVWIIRDPCLNHAILRDKTSRKALDSLVNCRSLRLAFCAAAGASPISTSGRFRDLVKWTGRNRIVSTKPLLHPSNVKLRFACAPGSSLRLFATYLLLAACNNSNSSGGNTLESGDPEACVSLVIELGPDGDATTDWWLYDAQQRPVRHVEYPEFDSSYHEEWTYHNHAEFATFRWFWGGEWPGYEAGTSTNTFDENDELVLTEDKNGSDDTVVRMWEFGWVDGLLVDEKHTDYGATRYVGTRTYTEQNQLARRILEYSTANFVSTYDYTWEDGRIATESYHESSDNADNYEQMTLWTYDDEGREVRKEIVAALDDVWEPAYAYRSTWDNDRLARLEFETGEDHLSWREEYTYENDRLVRVDATYWDTTGTQLSTIRRSYIWESVACP